MLGYVEFRDTLTEEIHRRLAAVDYSETSMGTYDKDNWAYRQAHKNGQRSTMRGILTLIDFLDQKESTNDRPISGDSER